MMVPKVLSVTEPQAHDAAVTICRGAIGAHIGIRYRADDNGTFMHAHLAFHHEFKVEAKVNDDVRWIVPSISDDELCDVATSARLVARRHKRGAFRTLLASMASALTKTVR